MSPRRYWTLGAVILAAALSARIGCHVGIRTVEPIFTARSAHDVTQGAYAPVKHLPGAVNNSRFGMVLPTALAARLWGLGDLSCTLWPMLCGLLLVLGVLALGAGVVGPKGALFAATLLAVVPVDVFFSSQLYSDLPMSLCWMLSAALFWKALGSTSRGLALGAGVLVGLSWMMREPGALFLLVLLLWAGRDRAWKLWLCASAGAAFVFVGECLIFAFQTGDPFYRLGIATSGVHARYMTTEYYTTTLSVWKRVFLDLPSMMWNPADPAFFCYAALPWAALGAAAVLNREERKDPVPRRLALWFLAIFVLFAALPVKLFPFRPSMVLLDRTLIPLSVPMALFLGWVLARRRWGIPALGGLVVVCLVSLAVVAPLYLEAKSEVRGALDLLRREVADLILADDTLSSTGHQSNLITFSRQFDPHLYVYSLKDADPSSPAARGGYVFINSAYLERTRHVYPPDRLRQVLDPPPSWERLYYREFRRRGESTPAIVVVYRIPGN
jgi:dolichyl-phosphate-mannose-protein mannosyltransferase